MTGLRRSALLEAFTLIALFAVAMPLKYWADTPQAVALMGPAHGMAFLTFLWFVARSWGEGLINGLGVLRLFIGAFIPFGGLVNERWLRNQAEKH